MRHTVPINLIRFWFEVAGFAAAAAQARTICSDASVRTWMVRSIDGREVRASKVHRHG
jgi:hypothetical protein